MTKVSHNQMLDTMMGRKAWVFMMLLGIAFAEPALAAMPWEGPLSLVACSFKGPVATAVAVIAIVVSGLLLAIGEISGIFKTMLGLLMGVAMAILASDWLLNLFGKSFAC